MSLTILFLITSINQNVNMRFYPNPGTMENPTSFEITFLSDTVLLNATCISKYGITTFSLDKDSIKVGEDFFGIIVATKKDFGYFYLVNSRGVKSDGIITNLDSPDKRSDFNWEAKVQVTDDTIWTLLLKIPVNQLNLTQNKISINTIRCATLKNPGEYEMGSLVSITGNNFYNLRYTLPLEIPTMDNRISYSTTSYAALVFLKDSIELTSGCDMSISNNNIRLGITISPEYYTLESNLDMFNIGKAKMIYYPEKRPFFTKDFELWQTDFCFLYTRLIDNLKLGFKGSFQKSGVELASFALITEERLSPFSADKILWGIRERHNTKHFSAGLFYLSRGKHSLAKGVDFQGYLPLSSHLNFQLTLDGNNKTDIFLHIFRDVKTGINFDFGLERLDSVNIETAYIPYPAGTMLYWSSIYHKITFPLKVLTEISAGISACNINYLRGLPFEKTRSLYFASKILPNLMVHFEWTPWYQYDSQESRGYKNLIQTVKVNYQPFKTFFILGESQTGEYFGGYLKYYLVDASFKKSRIITSAGLSFYDDSYVRMIRYYAKLKWNVNQNFKLRFFYQFSDISHQTTLQMLGENALSPRWSLVYGFNRINDKNQNVISRTAFVKFVASY